MASLRSAVFGSLIYVTLQVPEIMVLAEKMVYK